MYSGSFKLGIDTERLTGGYGLVGYADSAGSDLFKFLMHLRVSRSSSNTRSCDKNSLVFV